MQGTVAGEPDLEEGARILEVADPARRRDHVAGGAGERGRDDLRRRPRPARPLAGADLDETHLAEMKQRFADRRSADAELAHQLALGGKLVAGGKLAVCDQPLELIGDLLVELAATDGGDRHLVYL